MRTRVGPGVLSAYAPGCGARPVAARLCHRGAGPGSLAGAVGEGGQRDHDLRPAGGVAHSLRGAVLDADLAAVGAHDGLADGQPQAAAHASPALRPPAVRTLEPLEYPLAFVRGDPRSRVSDA